MAGKCDQLVPARVRSGEIDVACLLYGEGER